MISRCSSRVPGRRLGNVKKDPRYVQTIPEMQKELIERGLKDARLTVQRPDAAAVEPRAFKDEALTKVVQVAGELAVGGAVSGSFSLLRKPVTLAQLAERIELLLSSLIAKVPT